MSGMLASQTHPAPSDRRHGDPAHVAKEHLMWLQPMHLCDMRSEFYARAAKGGTNLRDSRCAIAVEVMAEDADEVPPLIADVVPAIGIARELRRIFGMPAPVVLDGDAEPRKRKVDPSHEPAVGRVDDDIQFRFG